jgi:hypothetical protein
MSAFVFGSRLGGHLEGVRRAKEFNALSPTEQQAATPPPSPRDKMVTLVAGLIPAEILAFHAILLQATTKVDEKVPKAVDAAQTQADAKPLEAPLTQITDEKALKWGFIVLCILAVAFFIAGRIKSGEPFNIVKDVPLALVPAFAFVGWTALQRATAFDAIKADAGDRAVIGIICAGLALAISMALTPKKEDEEPG